MCDVPVLVTVTASTRIARIYSGHKGGCHRGLWKLGDLCSSQGKASRFLTGPTALFGMTDLFSLRACSDDNRFWTVRISLAEMTIVFGRWRIGLRPTDSRGRLSLHGTWWLLFRQFFSDRFLEVIQRQAKAFFKLNLRFPSEQRAGFGDVGLALFGIVLG